jgi:small subunit ribosomal protein S10e
MLLFFIIPILINLYFFSPKTEGTLVCKKDGYLAKHSDEIPIPNLEVMCLLKTFKSKGFVKETFNWQCYYFYLTNEGIEYLRQYLSLPADIVPATLKVTAQRPRTG